MRAGVGEQNVPFQIKFKFICSKMMGLMNMPRLTIVQLEPVSPCVAVAKGGLATAQIGNTEI